MPAIGLIVTGEESLREFRIFVRTLETWHPNTNLYVYTDSLTDIRSVPFKGTYHIRTALDMYKGLNRQDMERRPGARYDSLWKDYMYEKANVLEWMLETNTDAWFMDADISFFAPLPNIPSNATLALSPHYIKERDTMRFGKYNAGFLWMRGKRYLEPWRDAGRSSRFFEQAALEDIAKLADQAKELYEFPIQVNFGWWRMIQATEAPSRIQERFSIFRTEASIGIRYDGKPLQSVHTHWSHVFHYQDPSFFNNWFFTFAKKYSKHPPLAKLLRALQA